MPITNRERVMNADHAVTEYATIREGRIDYDSTIEIVTDLIADLLHLVKREHGNPAQVLKSAAMHYQAQSHSKCLALDAIAHPELAPHNAVLKTNKKSITAIKHIKKGRTHYHIAVMP